MYRDPESGAMKEVWMVDVDLQHPNGRRERVRKISPVQTRRGAEQYEREMRSALLDGSFERKEDENKVPNLADFGEEFLAKYAAIHNKPSEQHAKKMILRVYLKPSLGPMQLDKIGTRAVEDLKVRLMGKQLSPKTVNNALLVLRKLLHYGAELGVLSAQSLPKIKMLKVPKQPFDFVDFEEAGRLIEAAAAEGRDSHAAILFALDTGARMGEQIALEWSDLDLKAREPVVRISRSQWFEHVTSTKGGTVRNVPLTGRLVTALKAVRHLRGPRVFCQDDGTSWTKEVYKKLLPRLLKKAGLRRFTWHDLRHTFASHLVMRGASLKAVQELLGHASITTTMRYAHLSPGHLRSTVNLLDAAPLRHDSGTSQEGADR
jgi:integrase